jgi:hypothetical protein
MSRLDRALLAMTLALLVSAALGLVFFGCAHVRRCPADLPWVEYGYCADTRYAECRAHFGPPIPAAGCWLTIDRGGLYERNVICVPACAQVH